MPPRKNLWYHKFPKPLQPYGHQVHRVIRMWGRNIQYQAARMSEAGIRANVLRRRILNRENRAPMMPHLHRHSPAAYRRAVLESIAQDAEAFRALHLLFDDAQRFSPNDAFHLCAVRDALKAMFGSIPSRQATLRAVRNTSALCQGYADRSAFIPLSNREVQGQRLLYYALNSLHELLKHPAYQAILFEDKFEDWGGFCRTRVGVPMIVGSIALAWGCATVPFICKFVVGVVVGFFTNEVRKWLDRVWTHKMPPRSGPMVWATMRNYRVKAQPVELASLYSRKSAEFEARSGT